MMTAIAPSAAPPRRRLISILIPVYNEEPNVELAYSTLLSVLEPEAGRYDFEFVFTDNHSEDGTFDKLRALCQRDHRLRVYRFSRNFGFQKSIYTAYTLARGDAAVQIDCDLQDPPELIRQFLRLWESGVPVVYGIRRHRPEGWLLRRSRQLFYWLIDFLSDERLPRDAGDFRLVDRRIIEELRKVRDTNIYLRGRIASFGFLQVGLVYDRHERQFGTSKFNLIRLINLALDGITSHSSVPLRLASYLGFLMVAGALILAAMLVVMRLTGTTWPPGFAFMAVTVLFSSGLNALCLGVMGEYIARIYEQLKKSPDVIIEEVIDPGAGSGGDHAVQPLP